MTASLGDKAHPMPYGAYALLIAITLAVYGQLYSYQFVNYDDDAYATDNTYTRTPFSGASIRWAFTSGYFNNWHPLTWLSHQLDCALFGLNAGAHHLVNVLLHTLNTLLLFEILRRMTGRLGPAVFAAALFSVHPLHVESVAWISERKDLLSTVFMFLSILAYHRYTLKTSLSRYLPVLPLFACALMSKSMAVTLPALLLLLDYWPLGRYAEHGAFHRRAAILFLEKAPLFALSLAGSLIAMTLRTPQGVSAGWRAAFGTYAYMAYVRELFWPVGLTVYYPHPRESLSLLAVAASAALLALISVVVFALSQRKPYLAVGWLWYLITLAPAAGFVQVGGHGLADRYTYIPLAGLFIMAAWGLADAATRCGIPKRAVFAGAAVLLIATGAAGAHQVRYWRDSTTLFEHAIQVTDKNVKAHYNLGCAYLDDKRYEDAANQFWEVLQIEPNEVASITNLGLALNGLGKKDGAIRLYYVALTIDPGNFNAQLNLGEALYEKGDLDQAATWLSDALAVNPDSADAYYDLGLVYLRQGKFVEAVKSIEHAIKLRPDFEAAHLELQRITSNHQAQFFTTENTEATERETFR